jgi:iron complex transport system substrate-binding protein
MSEPRAAGQGAQRIACLSTEAVETLYLLGAQDRVCGISGFTVHPPEARRDKPKISGYSSAQLDRILAVQPDLVIAFSDMQADIVAELVRAGQQVHVFNQRSLAGMLAMVGTLGALAGCADAAAALVAQLQAQIATAQQLNRGLQHRPRVWFEEWHEPLMSGVGWAAELVTLAGGDDCFPELSVHASAKQRIVADPLAVVARQPDIIIGSWCGRKFVPSTVCERPGWHDLPAVRQGFVREIKSADILSPGPGLVTRALPQLQALFAEWREAQA